MNLSEALRDLKQQDRAATIWIESGRPWAPDSRVLVAPEPDLGGCPDPSFEYFLEVAIIIETFGSPWHDLEGFTRRVIEYATFDA